MGYVDYHPISFRSLQVQLPSQCSTHLLSLVPHRLHRSVFRRLDLDLQFGTNVVYTVVVGSYVCVLLGFPVEYSEFYISVTQENGAVIAASDFFHIKRVFVEFSDLSRVSVARAIFFILAIVTSSQILF